MVCITLWFAPRYYFAIIDCCDKAVAEQLYAELDQIQLFEGAPMVCELSFVPDDVDFSGRQIRDSCTSAEAARSVASYQVLMNAFEAALVE